MKTTLAALGIVIAACFGPDVQADTFSLFNTGVDPGGSPLPGGSVDPHWSITAGQGITPPANAFVVNNQLSGTYAQSSLSSWIWLSAAGNGDVTGTNYTFTLTFDLTGLNPATAMISGSWGVDNNGFIDLNGSPAIGTGTLSLSGGTAANFNPFHDFGITGGFVSGINTLEFIAENDGGPGALNVTNLTGTASSANGVPETGSTLGLLALALAALVGVRRPRSIRFA